MPKIAIDPVIVAGIIRGAKPSYSRDLRYTRGNTDSRAEIAKKLALYFKALNPKGFNNQKFILECFPDYDSSDH